VMTPLTLLTVTSTTTTTTSSTQLSSPDQPEKTFRWVESGKRFRKDRVRKGQGRNSPDSPTTLQHTDSASSDDAASPSSEDSFDSSSGAVVPYARRITIHPALNAVASSQTRKMFSHCTFPYHPV
jgi:hypothetical protein